MIRPGPNFQPTAPMIGIGRGRGQGQMSAIGRLPTLPIPGIGRGRARHSGPEMNLDPSCFSDASVSKI